MILCRTLNKYKILPYTINDILLYNKTTKKKEEHREGWLGEDCRQYTLNLE